MRSRVNTEGHSLRREVGQAGGWGSALGGSITKAGVEGRGTFPWDRKGGREQAAGGGDGTGRDGNGTCARRIGIARRRSAPGTTPGPGLDPGPPHPSL